MITVSKNLNLLVVAVTLVVISSGAHAQDKTLRQQIAGTWVLVSNGGMSEGVGSTPVGLVNFDGDSFAVQIVSADIPQFTANDRQKGTPAENQASVRGSLAYFGTYSTSDSDHSVTLHIAVSNFPNWSSADQRWVISVLENRLTWTDPNGGGSAPLVWTRPGPTLTTRGGHKVVH